MKDQLLYRSGSVAFLAAAIGILLSGCSLSDLGEVIGPPPPPQIYVLEPPIATAPTAQRVPWQLSITVPEAPASIDTTRIALNPTPSRLDYYADAAWPDRVPMLVQTLLLEAFEGTERVSVSRDTDGLLSNYTLRTELREFQAHYVGGPPMPEQAASPPQITVRLDARLVSVLERRIIGNISVERTATAQANDLDSIVAAFNAALGDALTEVVNWTLESAPAS